MEPIETPTLSARGAALLLLLAAALLLLRTAAIPLVGPDEPRYARVAVEMQRARAWVRPTLAGEPWLEKPPLYYWLAGAAFARLGETELAARLPAVLATLLLVAATALAGARLYGRAAGMHAGFVLATSLLPFAYGHAATMDMLLAATVTLGTTLVALRVLGVAGRYAAPAAGACFGLATLAKGPLGLVLPALTLGGYVLATRDSRSLRRVVTPGGVLACALVAGPWYVAILRDQGRAFVDDFLVGHNVERFTSTIHNHPGSVFYYVPVIVAGLFPWSGLLVPAFALVSPRRLCSDAFLLCWLLLPLGFFTAAGSKLPGYILPCLPPLALLIGRAMATVAAQPAPRLRAAALVNLVLGASLAAALLGLHLRGDGAARAALPLGAWAVVVCLFFSARATRPVEAFGVLRVGAAGLMVLLALAAPPVLAARESGRSLFLPAHGREVLAFGAWRTAWMAGYFYDDGRVREVASLAAIEAAASGGSVLVVCDPARRAEIEARPTLRTLVLATGPRENTLVRVSGAR